MRTSLPFASATGCVLLQGQAPVKRLMFFISGPGKRDLQLPDEGGVEHSQVEEAQQKPAAVQFAQLRWTVRRRLHSLCLVDGLGDILAKDDAEPLPKRKPFQDKPEAGQQSWVEDQPVTGAVTGQLSCSLRGPYIYNSMPPSYLRGTKLSQ